VEREAETGTTGFGGVEVGVGGIEVPATVNVTGMVLGVMGEPGDETVMVSLYVPGARPLGLTLTENEEGPLGGGVVETVSVTGMVLGLPFAPEAETVMVPEYEPAEREEEFTETETVPELEPDAGETESQVWLPETVHESVPCPTFETEKD